MGFSLWGRMAMGLALAALLAYFTTPLAIAAARRLAFYDRPVGYKGHAAPTPYLGGAVVMLAFAVAVVLGAGHPARTFPLLGGVAILWAIGTIDDRRTVSPLVRVCAEFSLAVALSLLGLGWNLGVGPEFNALVNGVWVVGVINAFNLFDNMDGAASTMALVVAGGACALGWLNGNGWAVAGTAALAGACIGFLPHNLAKPARIFLGDGGSMPLGFAVAMLVASAAHGGGPSTLSVLTGVLLVSVPALDTSLVIVSRRRRGISILTGGQDHLTHRTRRRMRTTRRVALVLGATQALISAVVIVATRTSSAVLVYTVLGFVICAVVAILALEQAVETRDAAAAGALIAGGSHLGSPGARRLARTAPVALIVLGLGCGLSPLFAAYYDVGVWVPIGLVAVILAAIGLVFRPPQMTLPLGLMLAGVAGLGILSLISTGWAAAGEAALTDANRWLAYVAALLLMALLIRRPRHAHILLVAVGAGTAILAASVVIRLLGGDPGSLFLGGRLNGPLGYVNGEACVFAMGCWFGLALAERREAWVAGLGAAAAVVFASLTLLSQSRGAAIATAAAIAFAVLALPGRPRRVFALALVLGGLAAASGPLLDVYRIGQPGALPASTGHRAALALLVAAVVVGFVWAGLTVAAERVSRRNSSIDLRRVAAVAATLVVLAPFVVALSRASSIEHTVRTQWNAFVNLSDTSPPSSAGGQSRLLSGSGNRYDYWRIAWDVFRAHPLAGVGAGNYTAYYYRYRRTQEAIENPHSLELQMLSELGVLGALLLAVLLAGAAIGVRRLRAVARSSSSARTVAVAVSGILVVWLVDASGDWMQLLPGVTAIALAAGAVACTWSRQAALPDGAAADPRPPVRGPRPAMLAGAAVMALVLAVAGANLLRQGLAQRYLTEAQHALAARPGAAVSDANKSLRLDGANLDAYYVKAAGEARFDNAAGAEATLAAAAREDPQDFVTWVLLGDLQVRRHNFGAAKRFYMRAHQLDPNDPSVAALAENPATALGAP